jgi:hypothetical protein
MPIARSSRNRTPEALGLRTADRLGRQERALERLGGADVGLGRARLHAEPGTALREIDPGAGDPAGPDQIVDDRRSQDRDIRGLASRMRVLSRRRSPR